MPTKQNVASLDAKRGEKMIEVRLRFWTDDIAPDKGRVVPKHALTSGYVSMERNKAHGIDPSNARHFHSLLDVGAVIEKVLIEHGIVLHPSQKMRKYLR